MLGAGRALESPVGGERSGPGCPDGQPRDRRQRPRQLALRDRASGRLVPHRRHAPGAPREVLAFDGDFSAAGFLEVRPQGL